MGITLYTIFMRNIDMIRSLVLFAPRVCQLIEIIPDIIEVYQSIELLIRQA